MAIALVLALVALAGLPAPALAGWEWMSPLPQGNDLHGIWGSGPDDVFAVGDGGTIIHYDGNDWSVMENGIAYSGAVRHLQAVWGIAPDDVYAAGDEGAILHYDGQRWSPAPGTRIYNELHAEITGIWGASSTDVFAIADGPGFMYLDRAVLHFDGQSWSSTALEGEWELLGIWGTSPADLFVVDYSGCIFHYDGAVWSRMAEFSEYVLEAVWGTSPANVYAVGRERLSPYAGVILHYDGTAWDEMNPHGAGSLAAIWGSAADDIYAVGDGVVHFDGSVWRVVEDPAHGNAVWCSAAGEVFTAGAEGALYHFDGLVWTDMLQRGRDDLDLSAAWGLSPLTIFGMGRETIEYFDGAAWSTVLDWPGLSLESIWGASEQAIFAVDQRGVIVHYNGDFWSYMGSGAEYLGDVWGTGPQDVYAVGPQVLHYDGLIWRPLAGSPAGSSIWASSPQDIYVGSMGEIYHFDGTSWTTSLELAGDVMVEDLWGSGPDDVFAAGVVSFQANLDGWIYHYDGVGWEHSGGSPLPIRSLDGSSATDVAAAGSNIVLEFDGFDWRIAWSGSWWCELQAVRALPSGGFFVVGKDGIVLHGDGEPPLGVRLDMPRLVAPGDEFSLTGILDNPGPPLEDMAIVFVVRIGQDYWFWDDWTQEIDYRTIDVPTGTTEIEIVPAWIVPAEGLPVSSIAFYGAMLDPTLAQIYGQIASATVRNR